MKLDLNAPLSAKWRRDELWSQWQVEYNLLKTKPWEGKDGCVGLVTLLLACTLTPAPTPAIAPDATVVTVPLPY